MLAPHTLHINANFPRERETETSEPEFVTKGLSHKDVSEIRRLCFQLHGESKSGMKCLGGGPQKHLAFSNEH